MTTVYRRTLYVVTAIVAALVLVVVIAAVIARYVGDEDAEEPQLAPALNLRHVQTRNAP